jgi:hypothetical protein
MSEAPRRAPHGVALYLAVVQFLFVTCWTVYVIFLPRLLESAGIPAHYALWIVMFDQLVFVIMDVVMGAAADRAGRVLGRIGPVILGATAVSCAAFLLLPHAGLLGAAAPAVLLTLILIWAATSSALRAPPWALLGKHAAAPSLPWLNALMLSGIAIGGAVAPYLGVTLKNLDPRLPFAVSSLALLAVTTGLIRAERLLARGPAAAAPPSPPDGALRTKILLFLAACLLLAQGFQIHFALNSAGLYLRLAPAAQLEYLMPVFWIGFNLAMFPGAALAKRAGALTVAATAAVIGAAAAMVAARTSALDVLIAAQFVYGGAWGCVLMAGFSAALASGRGGREGLAVGLMFSMFAAAAMIRMGMMLAGINKQPDYAALLAWAPAALWAAGGALLLALWAAERRNGAPARAAQP